MLDSSSLSAALELATRAALAASGPLLGYFRSPGLAVDTKSDGTPVSRADREAEAAVLAALRTDAEFGGLDVLGEESGAHGSGTRLRWIVDPLDGTLSYTHGLPFFGTLVGLVDTEMDESLVGVAHFPALGWTYAATRGAGATRNGELIRVTSETDPAKAILCGPDDHVAVLTGTLDELLALRRDFKVRSYWDCVSQCLAADGGFGAAVEVGLRPWDLAATRLIVEEAGGEVRTRPSRLADCVDALLGAPAIVAALAPRLGFRQPPTGARPASRV